MVALVQRVRHASVNVDGAATGSIRQGLLILLGVHRDDSKREAEWIARKCANLRVFSDDDGKMNLSVKDVGGEALVVSQFTLYGDVRRGNRPSFEPAAPPEKAEQLYDYFVELLDSHLESSVQRGVFGASMEVELLNDGPVTLWIERMNETD
jgi:D-tyrosyl-tRNA(Tyr) deacylase